MDLKLDSTGDLDVTNAALSLTTGADAVRQHIRQRLLFFLGEWFLDTRLGVDWFGTILVKGPDNAAVHALLRKVIRETPGVKEILSFGFDLETATRTATLTVRVQLEDLTNYSWTFTEVLYGAGS